MAAEVEHRRFERDGISLAYHALGEGPVVVLLHGFPDIWKTWTPQMKALASAGYRAVALDMRGYHDSDKPESVSAYRLKELTADVEALLDHLGVARAHVVGHDWGGMVAWAFAMRHPRRLGRLVVMNAPHPLRFARALRSWRQLRKSWYMLFFQIPYLPEALLLAFDAQVLRRTYAQELGLTPAEMAEYVGAMQRPGAARGAVNYYRAMLAHPLALRARIETPVLVIWGERDRFLGTELATPSPRWVPEVQVSRIFDAGHWPQRERAERVNALLSGFLERSS